MDEGTEGLEGTVRPSSLLAQRAVADNPTIPSLESFNPSFREGVEGKKEEKE